MVEKLVSFWEGLLAGAMLVSGRVLINQNDKTIQQSPKESTNQNMCFFVCRLIM